MYARPFRDSLDVHRFSELQRLVDQALGLADGLELWAVGISLDKARLTLIDVQESAGVTLTLQ